MSADRTIVVYAAVIERDGRWLMGRRLAGTHLAGLWEFPGGKVHPGESPEQCLRREIQEELGVDSIVGAEIVTTEHAYPERRVRLHFHRCEIAGAPRPMLGQELRWVGRDELRRLDLPEADRDLVRILTDP